MTDCLVTFTLDDSDQENDESLLDKAEIERRNPATFKQRYSADDNDQKETTAALGTRDQRRWVAETIC